jgi:hypothetical protein
VPITRKIVAQDGDENQWLKIDHASRYIVNEESEWQMIFGPNSILSVGSPVVKIGAKFNENSFNDIQIIAYLYDQKNGGVANAGTCEFKLYKVTTPDWSDVPINTLAGSKLENTYFYINPSLSSLGSIDLQGGDTIMVEVTIFRLGVTYKDRAYINHLGIYDNLNRVKREVRFLDVTKKDI